MKKTFLAAAALLALVSTGFTGCKAMNNTGRINSGRIPSETTTESELREDAGKIKDDVSEAASDAGDKIKEKLSEAGSTVKEGMDDMKDRLGGSDRSRTGNR